MASGHAARHHPYGADNAPAAPSQRGAGQRRAGSRGPSRSLAGSRGAGRQDAGQQQAGAGVAPAQEEPEEGEVVERREGRVDGGSGARGQRGQRRVDGGVERVAAVMERLALVRQPSPTWAEQMDEEERRAAREPRGSHHRPGR